MATNDLFRRQFAAFVAKTKGDQELIVRSVTLRIFTALVVRSPVDTGRFRGNWQLQYRIPPSTLDVFDKSGAATIAGIMLPLSGFRAGDTIYMVNNLPYAVPLEYGHSKQAPAGMVRLTVTEFDQFLTRAVGEVKT